MYNFEWSGKVAENRAGAGVFVEFGSIVGAPLIDLSKRVNV